MGAIIKSKPDDIDEFVKVVRENAYLPPSRRGGLDKAQVTAHVREEPGDDKIAVYRFTADLVERVWSNGEQNEDVCRFSYTYTHARNEHEKHDPDAYIKEQLDYIGREATKESSLVFGVEGNTLTVSRRAI